MLKYKNYECFLKRKNIRNNCVVKPAPIANKTYVNSGDYIINKSMCCKKIE